MVLNLAFFESSNISSFNERDPCDKLQTDKFENLNEKLQVLLLMNFRCHFFLSNQKENNLSY